MKLKDLNIDEELQSYFKPYELFKINEIQTLPIENNKEYEIHKKTKKQNNKAKKLQNESVEKKNIIIGKKVKELGKKKRVKN